MTGLCSHDFTLVPAEVNGKNDLGMSFHETITYNVNCIADLPIAATCVNKIKVGWTKIE